MAILSVIASQSLLFSHQAHSVAWDQHNNPENMVKDSFDPFQYNYKTLPTKSSLTQKPWTDSYWPTYERGITYRWQGTLKPVKHTKETDAEFKIRKAKKMFFSEKELFFMGPKEVAKLSPAEKMDIINKDFDYSVTKSELKRTDSNAPKWEGLCHGWATAAINFKEPGVCRIEQSMVTPGLRLQGKKLVVPFACSDTKALLTFLDAEHNYDGAEVFAGTRCDDKKEEIEFKKTQHAQDINAGSFHIILTNYIGRLDQGFVYDRTKDQEVWNQPVEGYEVNFVGELPVTSTSAPGTVKVVEVKAVVQYTTEMEAHKKPKNQGDRSDFVVDQEYHYSLDIDASDNIIGGEWISEDFPDFVWAKETAKFVGPFKAVEEVYKKSLENQNH